MEDIRAEGLTSPNATGGVGWTEAIGAGGTALDADRGTNRPTPAEMRDPGAHDRGGWLTLDEACDQFGVNQEQLKHALQRGYIAGRRVADDAIAPKGVSPDIVVPEGLGPPSPAPRDEWLVQPDQIERLLDELSASR